MFWCIRFAYSHLICIYSTKLFSECVTACREGSSNEVFCLSTVFSLTVGYSGAASLCRCSSLGSYSNESCLAYGGQCRCKLGTTGRRCDVCDLMHYSLSDQGCTGSDDILPYISTLSSNLSFHQPEC